MSKSKNPPSSLPSEITPHLLLPHRAPNLKRARYQHHHQCDQIGRLFDLLGYKLLGKSGPNSGVNFWAIVNCTCKNDLAIFGQYKDELDKFLFYHLITLNSLSFHLSVVEIFSRSIEIFKRSLLVARYLPHSTKR